MFKLFLRFYLLLLILAILLLVYGNDLTTYNRYMLTRISNEITAVGYAPMFHYLIDQLQEEPQAKWPGIIAASTPTIPHYPIDILSLNQIQLSSKQESLLVQGKPILDTHFDFELEMFLSSNNQNGAMIYQRIGQSDQVLAYPLIQARDFNMLASEAWLITLIEQHIKGVSLVNQNAVLASLSRNYGFAPTRLIMLSSLSPVLQAFLIKQRYYYTDLSALGGIPLSFYYLLNKDQVLLIGPYPILWYIKNFAIFWFGGIVLCLFFILFLSLSLFHRDLHKLKNLATHYGKGEFGYDIKLSRFNSLYAFYHDLKGMGLQIKNLLISHQDLTQAISHEIKTPLARLKFALTMAESAEGNKSEAKEYFQAAHLAVNDLNSLISELLVYQSFAHQDFKPQLKAVIVADWLRANLNLHQAKAIHLNIHATAENIQIKIVAVYFKKLLDNLLSNALRYAKTRVVINLDADKTYCYLSIADDGPGIPKEERDRIFEPFVSLEASRNKALSGQGLGLAIASRIATLHQARIEVSDSEMGGAKFTIILPHSS